MSAPTPKDTGDKSGGGDEITPAPEPHAVPTNAMRDKATDFLVSHSAEGVSFTYEEEKAVVRRIDLRVLVLLLGAYFFQQLDKSSLRFVFPHSHFLIVHDG
jgi:hypothetical protein